MQLRSDITKNLTDKTQSFPISLPELQVADTKTSPTTQKIELTSKGISGWYITTKDMDISAATFARDVALFKEDFKTLSKAYGVDEEELRKVCQHTAVRSLIEEAKKQVEETGHTVSLARDILEGALPTLNEMIHDKGLEPKDRLAAFREVRTIAAIAQDPGNKSKGGNGPHSQMVFVNLPDNLKPPGIKPLDPTPVKVIEEKTATHHVTDRKDNEKVFVEEDVATKNNGTHTFVREEKPDIDEPNFGIPPEYEDEGYDDEDFDHEDEELAPLARPSYPEDNEADTQTQRYLDFINGEE